MMTFKNYGFLLLIVLLTGLGRMHGQTVHTVSSLADSGPGTLREAFSNALWDDTIRFDARGIIRLTSAGLTFDKGLVIDGPGADSLVVHGDSSHVVFTFNLNAGDDLTIRGISVNYGSPSGFIVNGGEQLLLEDVTVNGNFSLGTSSNRNTRGGGLFSSAQKVIMNRCTFSNNRLNSYLQDADGGGAYLLCDDIEINDCLFQGNRSVAANPGSSSYSQGGGLFATLYGLSSRIKISRTSFIQNYTFAGGSFANSVQNGHAEGSGFYIYGSPKAVVAIDSCQFIDQTTNAAGSFGKYAQGVACQVFDADSVYITNSQFTNNDAPTGISSDGGINIRVRKGFKMDHCTVTQSLSREAGALHLKGVYLDSLNADIQDCVFDGNGSINSSNVFSGAIHVENVGKFNFRRNRIVNSSWTGLRVEQLGKTNILDCEFSDNNGGNLIVRYAYANRLLVQNCTFGPGGGFSTSFTASTNVEVKNCAFTDCSRYMYLSGSQPKFTNCLFSYVSSSLSGAFSNANNEVPISGGGNVARQNFLAAHFTQPTDLHNTDPRMVTFGFNGGPTRTFTLHPTSPAIDRGGLDTLTTDQRGFIRGSLIDSGPFEFGGTDPGTVTISSQSPSTGYCEGENVTLSIAATGSGNLLYQWLVNGQPINGATQNSLLLASISPADAGQYTCTATNGSTSDTSSTITVTVNPLPSVTAGPDQAICDGQSTTLTASGSTGSYLWDNNLGSGPSQTISPISTTTYTVTLTDSNSCQATDAVTITVNTFPNANAGPDQAICAGQSASLNASGGSSYLWDNNLGNGASQTVSPASTTTYTVTVTDGNACQATDAVTISVNPLPSANAGPDQAICAGQSASLNASGGSAYLWDNNLGSGASQTVSPASTTTYTVTVTDGNACQATDAVTITVNPLPQVAFTGLDSAYCTTDAATALQGLPSGGTFSGPGVSGTDFDPASAGIGVHVIQYQFTDQNGCSDSSSQQTEVSVCIGIGGPIAPKITVEVFPNPAQEHLTIRFSEGSPEEWELQVYDMLGKRIVPGRQDGAVEMGLDLNGLSAGAYHVLLTKEGQSLSFKFLKSNN